MNPLTCPHCGANVTGTVGEVLHLGNALIESACLACDRPYWIALSILVSGGRSVTLVVSLLATPEEEGYGHRHLWYDDNRGQWIGPGGELDTEIKAEIKQAFFVVLDKTRIARPLAFALARDEMGFDRFHFQGTTFGYDSVWCCLPDPDLPGVQYQSYGERFTEGLTDAQEAAMSAGVLWLLALDGTETADANELTVEWIKQWEGQQDAQIDARATPDVAF